MEILLIVLVLVAVAAYFLFFKKAEQPQLPAADKRELPAPREAAVPKPAKPEEPSEPAPEPSGELAAEEQREAPAPEETAEEGPPVEVEEPAAEPTPARKLFSTAVSVAGIRNGLGRSRDQEGFVGKLRALFSGRTEIDSGIAEEIEEVLLASDVGVATTQALLERVRDGLGKGEFDNSEKVWEALRAEATTILDLDGRAGAFELRAKPTVVLMVGVNGAGKTTTIGKLATRMKDEGHTCVLAAADTFRAAAVQQLMVWGRRVGCEVVKGKDGADPGSVVFDAIKRAEEIGADVVLADTAGRLHTKSNLMAEMEKMARTADKALAGAPHETLLVIDATNGQNALAQAQEFKESLELSGVVLTKLDGTAKGGVVLGISDALKLPVRFIGLGERPDDLHEFSASGFVEALLGGDDGQDAA